MLAPEVDRPDTNLGQAVAHARFALAANKQPLLLDSRALEQNSSMKRKLFGFRLISYPDYSITGVVVGINRSHKAHAQIFHQSKDINRTDRHEQSLSEVWTCLEESCRRSESRR